MKIRTPEPIGSGVLLLRGRQVFRLELELASAPLRSAFCCEFSLKMTVGVVRRMLARTDSQHA